MRFHKIARNRWARVGLALIIVCVCLSSIAFKTLVMPGASLAHTATAHTHTAEFVLDNVAITVNTPYLPGAKFTVAQPGFPNQVASAVQLKPFEEISITAIPFGTVAGTELNTVASAGGASKYLSALQNFRLQRHAQQQPGPIVLLFGKKAPSVVSLVPLTLDGIHTTPTLIVEWVAEAGNRLWLARISQEETASVKSLATEATFIESLKTLTITSTTLYKQSTLANGSPVPVAPPSAAHARAAHSKQELPRPAWWNTSACDTTVVPGSYPLGTYYQGMPACGSRHALAQTARFPGAQQQEWQSIELSMRYLYLAYGIRGYRTTAGSMVADYTGSYPLRKISNGTRGEAPQPGDVLSFSPNDASGFTAVVTAAQVDHGGNGSIQVIEQNGAPGGSETLAVHNWQVQVTSWGGWVSAWLHAPHAVPAGVSGTSSSQPHTGSGYASVIQNFQPQAATHPSAVLGVPYISQYQGQPDQNCDCGPAAVGMTLEYYGVSNGGSLSNFLIQIRNATGNTSACTSPDFPADTSFANLESALNHYGVTWSEIPNTLSPQPSAQIQAMQQATNAGKPVIALVSGADLGRGSNYGSHWLVVTGFSSDGQTVYINDPDNQSAKLPGWIVGGQITLSLATFSQAAYDAPSGPYGIIVGGGNGGGSLNPPTLQSPPNGSTQTSRTVTFSWSPPNSPNITGYTLHVSTSSTIDGTGAPLILDTGVGGTSYTYTFGQDYSTLWWSVATWNSSNQRSGFASAWTFAINTSPPTPNPPTLQAPPNGSTQTSRTVTFSWSPPGSPNINGYTLHVSTTSTVDGSGANLILDTGVGGTSYTYTFNQDYATLWWSVATWNTSNQRSGFAPAWTFAINTTPPDTTPPTVTWTQPVTDGGIYHCQAGAVQLQASASDNVAVAEVDFLRWDAVNNTWVDLGTSSSAPYQVSVDCGTLNPEWNQTNVVAYDTAGNSSTTNSYIWLYRDVPPPAPSNLTAQAANCLEVDLSWTDNSGGQADFNIYRDGSLIGQDGAGTTTYQDTSVDRTTGYSYTVTALSGSLESPPSNTVTITTPACPPVANDDVENPTTFSAPSTHLTEDTRYASVAADDPVPANCGSGSGQNSHSVWFSFTSGSDRNVTLSTAGSDYDTVLAVWTGTRGSMNTVACDDDYGGWFTSEVSFSAHAGTTYIIEVMSWANSAGGNLTLTEAGVTISKTWYFGEGYTGSSFSEYLTLANPNSVAASVQVTYLLNVGGPVVKSYTVPATARYTINVNGEVPAGRNVSMVVTANVPIIAERPMYFTYTGHSGMTIPGGTDVLGATALGTQYDFGYLDTSGVHDTYLTILNPQSATMTVTVHYYPSAGGSQITRTHTVAAHSRGTVKVNNEGLAAGRYGALVTLSEPGLVERPMYLVDSTTEYTGSADVVGVRAPLAHWYFAEGFTSASFSERYILFNPNSATATATLTFLKSDGTTVSVPMTLAAGTQQVVNANSVLGASINNSATVSASLPILAERFISFSYLGSIPGATDVLGAAAPGYVAYFAEGFTSSLFNEYLTLENPDPTNTAYVYVTYLPSDGSAPYAVQYVVNPQSRYTVHTNDVMFGRSFSMQIMSSAPIVAERPMYFNYRGSGQTGGTDVVGYQP